MKLLRTSIVFLLVISCFWGCTGKQAGAPDAGLSSLYNGIPFDMPRVERPVFADNRVSLTDFGGKGDGVFLNTDAFADAIGALERKKGGTLVIPAGIWHTGPIVLKSGICLFLEKGALIRFSSDFDIYPQISTVFEGLETRRCQSPISGNDLVNVAITGYGTINGGGDAWRPLKREKVTDAQWNQVVKSGGKLLTDKLWFPSEKSMKGHMTFTSNVPDQPLTEEEWTSIHDFLRPVLLSLVNCKNVWLEGVLFENSPSWNLHPLMCENIIIEGITVRNPAYAQNGDGLDLESCKNALIINSTFDVGDDAICLKSGKDEDGRRRGIPTENVIVDNCRVFKGHGGFVVGSEMSGGVRNVSVSNCQFLGTDVGLRFKSCRGRGGLVENIFVNNVYMSDIVREALLFDLYYGKKDPEADLTAQADETTPSFRDIHIRNVTASNAGKAMLFNGLPEMNIRNVTLENICISAKYGAELAESDGIIFRNVEVIPQEGVALQLKNVKNMSASQFRYPEALQNGVDITGPDTRNIRLSEASELKHIAAN